MSPIPNRLLEWGSLLDIILEERFQVLEKDPRFTEHLSHLLPKHLLLLHQDKALFPTVRNSNAPGRRATVTQTMLSYK